MNPDGRSSERQIMDQYHTNLTGTVHSGQTRKLVDIGTELPSNAKINAVTRHCRDCATYKPRSQTELRDDPIPIGLLAGDVYELPWIKDG